MLELEDMEIQKIAHLLRAGSSKVHVVRFVIEDSIEHMLKYRNSPGK